MQFTRFAERNKPEQQKKFETLCSWALAARVMSVVCNQLNYATEGWCWTVSLIFLQILLNVPFVIEPVNKSVRDGGMQSVCAMVLPSTAFQQNKHPSVVILLPVSNSIDFKGISNKVISSPGSNLKVG